MTTFLIALSACLAALTVYNAHDRYRKTKHAITKLKQQQALITKLDARIRNSKEYREYAIHEAQTGDEVAAKIMLSYAMEEIEKGEGIIKELETLKETIK